jgi:hypothetical protein
MERISYPGLVPMSPDEFYAHAMRAADVEGRLPLSRMTGWDVFPFEQTRLRVAPLAPPVLPEPARAGEGGRNCSACEERRKGIWSDAHWRLSAFEGSGAPIGLVLEPHAHHDLPDLPEEWASELGLLVVRITHAIESLPHIARVHVSRWGDGDAHLHIFFLARPIGFPQLQGTCLVIWSSLLPAVPPVQRDRDAAAVAQAIASSYGGRAHSAS